MCTGPVLLDNLLLHLRNVNFFYSMDIHYSKHIHCSISLFFFVHHLFFQLKKWTKTIVFTISED